MGYSAPSGGSNYERNYDATLPVSSSYTPTNGLFQLASDGTSQVLQPQIYDGTTWINAFRFNTSIDYAHWYNSLFVSNNGNFRINNSSPTVTYKIVLMRWY